MADPPSTSGSTPSSTPGDSPAELLGSRVGDYRITAVLGEGAVGIVYAAEHVTLGHRTACKVLRPEVMRQQASVDRFLAEARQVSKIRHNNLIDIFDIGELPDGRLYYVMEYLAGLPLSQVVARAPLSFAEIISLGRQVCAGLAAAHAAGLVHRDLSPDNLILCERPGSPPLVKVINFGVAEVGVLCSDGKSIAGGRGGAIAEPCCGSLVGKYVGCRGLHMTAQNANVSLGRFIFLLLLNAVFFPALTLLVAGDWHWVEGWIFSIWFDAMVLSNILYLYFKDPALLVERSKLPGADNQKTWDKYLLSAVYVLSMVWLVVMPLDARRFGWSPAFPVWLKLLGGVALLPALFLIYRATADNTFLSTRVRIQTDRKQHVVSTGVYGFVRHPLYLGCAFMIFGAPLLLGSLYGLALGVISLAILVVRILGEESVLTKELDGYVDYKQKVKYRLIPFVW